ncbi:SDR family NAD(P)-dependent oxidoreductase, partial [Enhygromyxa salina]|uniref:SDR family NAD(P)-dependent oxidoreductase n=1 Tax=Enhygromyxa salina TaxID=215803 RepID=UPI0011BA9750
MSGFLPGSVGLWRRALVPVAWPEGANHPAPSPYRDGGVYLIVGGAGTMGVALSSSLARDHAATLVWMGRRPLDAQIRAKAEAIAALGGRVVYVQADVGDRGAVETAMSEILAACGELHGVVHAALAHHGAPLDRVSPEAFAAASIYKSEGARNLLLALREVPLDFFVCFSSIQSLVGDLAQGAYAAASAYQDALADQLDGVWPWPVRTIDWGYWGEGATGAADNRERLAAIGYGVVEARAGLEALAAALRSSLARVVVVAAAADVLADMGVLAERRLELPPAPVTPCGASISTALADAQRIHVGSADASSEASQQWERHLGASLVELFAGLGLAPGVAFEPDPSALAHHLAVGPEYVGLLASLLELLDRHGQLRARADGRLELIPAAALPQSDLAPSLAPHQRLLAACVAAAPAVVRGELPATQVLFPAGSSALVEGIYRDNPIADGFNSLCAALIQTHARARLAEREPTRPLRILEIGAGTGGTTAAVLAALSSFGTRVHYTYTDVSEAFLDHGRARFGDAAAVLEFGLFDVSREPAGQGYALGSYDLVLAANVLHATARIRESIRHARALLGAGGWLVLNEVTRVEAFTTMTFGLLRGWWAFEDAELRLPGGPLLDVDRWRRALVAEGFAGCVALGRNGLTDDRSTAGSLELSARASASRPLAGVSADRSTAASLELSARASASHPPAGDSADRSTAGSQHILIAESDGSRCTLVAPPVARAAAPSRA